MSGYCGSWAWLSPEKELHRFFCGHACCERVECRDLFWHRRVKLITALIKENRLIRFFTLTLDPDMIPLGVDSWDYIHLPWVKMRHRLMYYYPEFLFVAILEKHKDNDRPHIHGFTNVWISQVDWSIMWKKSKGGEIVWIEQVKSDEVSSYVSKELEVAKYVGKDNLIGGYKQRKGHRTLWRSKGLRANYELDTGSEWSIIKQAVFTEDGEYTDFFAKKGVWNGSKTK